MTMWCLPPDRRDDLPVGLRFTINACGFASAPADGLLSAFPPTAVLLAAVEQGQTSQKESFR
jgi:hypothetical protein